MSFSRQQCRWTSLVCEGFTSTLSVRSGKFHPGSISYGASSIHCASDPIDELFSCIKPAPIFLLSLVSTHSYARRGHCADMGYSLGWKTLLSRFCNRDYEAGTKGYFLVLGTALGTECTPLIRSPIETGTEWCFGHVSRACTFSPGLFCQPLLKVPFFVFFIFFFYGLFSI